MARKAPKSRRAEGVGGYHSELIANIPVNSPEATKEILKGYGQAEAEISLGGQPAATQWEMQGEPVPCVSPNKSGRT
jgi:hypothetical protein